MKSGKIRITIESDEKFEADQNRIGKLRGRITKDCAELGWGRINIRVTVLKSKTKPAKH